MKFKSLPFGITNEMLDVVCIYAVQVVLYILIESSTFPPILIVTSSTALFWTRLWMFGLALFTYNQWKQWTTVFRYRLRRGDDKCPSTFRRPDTDMYTGATNRWAQLPPTLKERSTFRGSFPTKVKTHNDIARRSASGRRNGEASRHLSASQRLSDERAVHLDFDHLHLSFIDFLWCSLFVVPPIHLGFIFGGPNSCGLMGILKLRMKQWLGLAKVAPDEVAEKTLVNFFLNSTMATWITKIEKVKTGEKDLQTIVHVHVPHATRIFKDCTVESSDFELTLNLTTCKVLKATFRGQCLAPQDALSLAYNSWGAHTHTIIHSYSNWGINIESTNPFLRRMAVVNIKYNNVGIETYPWTTDTLVKAGLAKYITSDVTKLHCHHGPQNVPQHQHLQQLAYHSPYIYFLIKVRAYFLKEFSKHQDSFPGIDGEAFFIGTVMHSTDHQNTAYILNDINQLRGEDPDFEADCEWATFTLSCFTDRVPIRGFDCSFRSAPHVFFQKVYAYAKGIDPRLADYMECTVAE